MQKPCEHLARTSSRRRGSCVFSFRLGTRNLRLPTAASNHRRCTHTNTLAQTHDVSHGRLTKLFLFFPPSSFVISHTRTLRRAVTSRTRTQIRKTHRGTTTRRSSFPEKRGSQSCRRCSRLVLTQEGKSGASSWRRISFYCCKESNKGRAACDTRSQNSPALLLNAGNILFLFGVDATSSTLFVRLASDAASCGGG